MRGEGAIEAAALGRGTCSFFAGEGAYSPPVMLSRSSKSPASPAATGLRAGRELTRGQSRTVRRDGQFGRIFVTP
jgi:hypothetical protein